CVQSIVFPYSF
nr:immunoglobulin light chain junction region [Macaca mulatta]MOW61761.1 immunoglobulin light chain junction region [Macaca mulatta]MOW61983.1 immunoglobulin light chain junction region [Macaca mulatta]MOW62024.1 immunoglobulin light chain junction region [Macaca mulatta]MOW62186.1 immunoglobulin light chain junction region [Macaca mulatta]